jgi:RNA polymerase sigma factor (sigma-70 family)
MSVCTRVRKRTAVGDSDESLWLRAIAGDDDALEKLFRKYRAVIAAQVRRYFPRGGFWLNDCIEEAVVRVLDYLPEYQPELSSFNHWSYLLARSAVFAFLAEHEDSRYDVSLDALEEGMVSAPGGPEEEYASTRLNEEVARLDAEQGPAVDGYYYDDKTDEETGETMGIVTRRANYRRHQGLRAIRRGLSEVPFMSIRPKLHHFRYSIEMNHRRDASASAHLGGEDGDNE